MPEPIELPARVLDAAKRSPTFASILENWNSETSIARLEIAFSDAKDMIRDLFSGYQSDLFPRDLLFAESKDFPLLRGWTIELFYRGILCSRQTVEAELRGPGYRDEPVGPWPGLRRRA
jgi:hypothetical protein